MTLCRYCWVHNLSPCSAQIGTLNEVPIESLAVALPLDYVLGPTRARVLRVYKLSKFARVWVVIVIAACDITALVLHALLACQSQHDCHSQDSQHHNTHYYSALYCGADGTTVAARCFACLRVLLGVIKLVNPGRGKHIILVVELAREVVDVGDCILWSVAVCNNSLRARCG